jgi:predicted nucleic acid-binding protein
MILVDTSVWVRHLREGDAVLTGCLDAGEALGHPMVIGELAMGNLHGRGEILGALRTLPGAVVASHDEVMDFIEREQLHSQGVGYVDAHLLASVRLTPDARLWTLDRRLGDLAARMGVV